MWVVKSEGEVDGLVVDKDAQKNVLSSALVSGHLDWCCALMDEVA